MLTDVKCEVRTLVFQRTVSFHSTIETLPNDSDALGLARADEVFIEAKGGSHLHKVDVPEPIIDAITFEDAVIAAQAKIDFIDSEVSKLDVKQVDGIKLLLSIGLSTNRIAELANLDIEVIKKVSGL
jgi:hypothetical protein